MVRVGLDGRIEPICVEMVVNKNKSMSKNKYLPWVAAMGFAASLVVALPVFAQTQAGALGKWGGHFGMHGVLGTVSAVNGTTITVTGKTKPNATSTAAVYAVDASNAKVFKNGAASAVSNIATGDMIIVQGTVNGSNITATVIRDGMMARMMGKLVMRGWGAKGFGMGSTSTPPVLPIQGNGQPVVAGNIVSISGTTLTITNASNVTYTIDASNAKIVKDGTSTTISGLATGDSIVAQGTVNGTSVTAASIIDHQGNGDEQNGNTPHFGFFGAIGNFFKHLFGF